MFVIPANQNYSGMYSTEVLWYFLHLTQTNIFKRHQKFNLIENAHLFVIVSFRNQKIEYQFFFLNLGHNSLGFLHILNHNSF